LLEAGAGKDFIDMVCVLAKNGVSKFKATLTVYYNIFDEFNKKYDLSIDLKNLESINSSIDEAVDMLCSSDTSTFSANIKMLENTLASPVVFEDLFEQFNNQTTVKMKAVVAQIDKLKVSEDEFSSVTAEDLRKRGGRRYEILVNYLYNIEAAGNQEEVDAIINDPSIVKSISDEVYESVRDSVRSLKEEYLYDAKAKPYEGQVNKMQSEFFASIDKLNERIKNFYESQTSDFADLMALRYEKEKDIFVKVFNYKVELARNRSKKLSSEGANTTILDNAIDELVSKLPEFVNVYDEAINAFKNFKGGAQDFYNLAIYWDNKTDEVRMKIKEDWELKQKEVEKAIGDEAKRHLISDFLNKADATLLDLKNKLESVNSTALNELYSKLESRIERAWEAFNESDYDKAIVYLDVAKKLFSELEKQWANVNEKYSVETYYNNSINILNNFKKAVNALSLRGIDVSQANILLESLEEYLHTAGEFIKSEEYGKAKTNLEKADELFKQLKAKIESARRLL